MSNFTVNGVYSYSAANIYSYLGRVPIDKSNLERFALELTKNKTSVIKDVVDIDYDEAINIFNLMFSGE